METKMKIFILCSSVALVLLLAFVQQTVSKSHHSSLSSSSSSLSSEDLDEHSNGLSQQNDNQQEEQPQQQQVEWRRHGQVNYIAERLLDSEVDPRPRTKNFGLPRSAIEQTSSDRPIDVYATNKRLKATHSALEHTQLLSGSELPRGHDRRNDNPLATVQRVVESTENLVANTLNDQFGIVVPTKLVEGKAVESGEDLIELATAFLKTLIATPRSHGRLPTGVSSSRSSRERSRQSASDDTGPTGRGNSTASDPAQVSRTLFELLELLARLALDENNLQDPAFEQVLDRIRSLIANYRSKPVLRT